MEFFRWFTRAHLSGFHLKTQPLEIQGDRLSLQLEQGDEEGPLSCRKSGWWFQMGVFKNRGTPNWMVYNGKPY